MASVIGLLSDTEKTEGIRVMKRRSNPVKRSGTSPYQRKQKKPYHYPEWVTKERDAPEEIQRELRLARNGTLVTRRAA